MSQVNLHALDWYQALTLPERLASGEALRQGLADPAFKAELAQRRLERWRTQPQFAGNALFAQRLEQEGIGEEHLLHVLGEPIEALAERLGEPPDWLVTLLEAFEQFAPDIPPPEGSGLLVSVDPLMAQGRARLRAAIAALAARHAELPFAPDMLEELLFAQLPPALGFMVSRVMVLELNIARLRGQLRGEMPQQRFASFVERLAQPAHTLALLQAYPVLARHVVQRIESWLEVSVELATQLADDWPAIRAAFCPDQEPGKLVHIQGNAGDRHRGGRSVQILSFESGFKLVYKPKSLAADAQFQRVLEWFNARGASPALRTLGVLDRGSYGWVEYVEPRPCRSAEELERFYLRQGAYLALLYMLEATDLHSENVIAMGEHPMIVDLEALFHPRLGQMDLSHASVRAEVLMSDSVLRIGLLPQRRWSAPNEVATDLSGLGGAGGQLTPTAVPDWEAAGTDEMRLVRRRVELPGSQNKPRLEQAEISLLDQTETIVAGFTAFYQLLLAHRDELLAPDGPLAGFADVEVRVVVRQTQSYMHLLEDSFHPDVLRSALDRDRFFDRLWIGAAEQPLMARLIPAERADLLCDDVPLFTTRPGTRGLWDSRGEHLGELLEISGLDQARRRLDLLGPSDLQRQLWFIRASIASLGTGGEQGHRAVRAVALPEGPVSREQLLAAARAVGDQLELLAMRGEADATWIGLSMADQNTWLLVPLGADLYDGLPGIALFLAYLGQLSGEARYTRLAEAALSGTLGLLDGEQPAATPGAFDGLGGVIYLLAHLGTIWSRPDLLTLAETLVERLPALIDQDERLDIISGAAGCLGALLALYQARPAARTLEVATRCGERLLAAAQPQVVGLGWLTHVDSTAPLTGFSHGAAGMAWALLELAAVSGDARFHSAALSALAYERSVFSAEARNWPDLRDFMAAGRGSNEARFSTMWCHGAPGIGMGRLRALRHHDDDQLREELAAAVRTTLETGFGSNHSLCHGDLGNLELLLLASYERTDLALLEEVERLAALIVASIGQHGWLCGVPLGVETPGLMTGLAGIGYQLLRLVEPAAVPSVLVLDPPRL